jgi:chaperonin cofactor prefoldin
LPVSLSPAGGFLSRKSSQVEAQLSALAQNLQEKEAQLEALKLSESQEEASGLSAFLDEQVTPQQVEKTPVAIIEAVPVIEPLVSTTQPLEATACSTTSGDGASGGTSLCQCPNFSGLYSTEAAVKARMREISPESSEVEQLHTQLQQLMVQMASVQTALSARTNTVTSEAQVSSDKKAVVPASWVELQVVKCWSGENMAS